MSNITISNLHPAGSDLFSDSETYLKELSAEELGIQGGLAIVSSPICTYLIVQGVAFAASAVGAGITYVAAKGLD